jgi:chaperonin GroEL (HSP60 family)
MSVLQQKTYMEGKRQINLKLEENGTHQDMKKKKKKKLCGINAVRPSVCLYRLQIYIEVKMNENKSRTKDALTAVAKSPRRLGFVR